MNKVQYIALLVLSFSLTACGGGGSDLPEPRPSGSINGVVHDAPVTGATIKIFAFGSGIKGSLLGETKTLPEGNGSFTIPLQVPNQPILIEATGGQYTEEASGTLITIAPEEGLRALSFFNSGVVHTINLTPFTMLATGLAENQIESGVPVSTAIQNATKTVSALVGANVDVVATTPRNIQISNGDELAVVNATELYGFTIASFSSYTSLLSKKANKEHRDFSSFSLTKLMYQDIRADGVLDGLALNDKGEKQQLSFANKQFDRNVYLSFIARHMLAMANSPANKTGITAQDLLENAKRLAVNNTPAFPGVDSEPLLEINGPAITSIDSAEQTYSGSINFAVTIEDSSPISSVSFDVDGILLAGRVIDIANPQIKINTNDYIDGKHTIGVTAVDDLGNSSSTNFTVFFDNDNTTVPTPTSPTIQLGESALPYSDSVNKNEKSFYIISELENNGLYAVSLTELTGNVNLSIFTDNLFSSELCSSVQISLSKESCVINASTLGQLHIVVDGASVTQRASFLLSVKPVMDLSSQLPFSNTIKAEIKQFVMTGLTPSTAYTVELTGLNDNDIEEKQDDDLLKLIVSDNGFTTTSCASKRNSGGFFRDNQGCIATSNVKGELYIGIEGVPGAENESGSMDYTLSLDRDNTLIDMTMLLPQDTDISRLMTYHKVTGLDPTVRYVVGMETSMFGPSPALSVYTNSNFDSGSHICSKVDQFNLACTAMPNTNGDLFFVIDAFQENNGRRLKIDVLPWKNITANMPFNFTITPPRDTLTAKGNQFLFLTGLEPSTPYGFVNWNDKGQNGSIKVYENDQFIKEVCSFPPCGANPDASGELYFSIFSDRLENDFVVAPYLDSSADLPLQGQVKKEVKDYFIDISGRQHVIELTGMQNNADLSVFTDSINIAVCQSALTIDNTTGTPLDDFCLGTKKGDDVYYVKVDGVLTEAETPFTIKTKLVIRDAFFGAKDFDNSPPTPIVRFPMDATITKNNKNFIVILGLEADSPYTITLSDLTADADLFVYQGAKSVQAGNETCSSLSIGTTAETCMGTSDVNGELYIHIEAADAEANYTIDVTSEFDVTPRDITGNFMLNDEVTPWLSQYYVIKGLEANSTHTINLIHDNEDADLYIYNNIKFSTPICTSVNAKKDETCLVNANADGEIYIRVFGFDRVIVPITYTLQIQ